jgi:hypothetical protein
LAGEEPHHFAQYLLQAMARGAIPSTYIMGTPDDNPYACLGIAGELTRFHRDHEDVYRELVPAAETLLVRPDQFKSGAVTEFQGLYLSLLQRHVPFDVLPEERLTEADLGRYRVVVLPDLGPLAPEAVAAIDSYAGSGGAVVATGNSGLVADEVQLACLPVRRRLSRHDTEEAIRSFHLRWGNQFLPVVGAFDLVEPSPGAEVGLLAMSRAPYGPPEKCHGHLELDHPGRLSAPYGNGQATLMPWTVGRSYREVGLTAHRDVFVDEVVRAGGPQVDTELPEQVEVVLGRSVSGTVIHLLNRSGDADQRFGRPLPIAEGWLTLPDGVTTVEALCAGRQLRVEGGRVLVPTIALFEVLVARP